MSIHKDNVVQVDLINPGDFLSAHPATNGGRSHGCITVTHGADLSHGGQYSISGVSQSVCVPAGKELAVITKLGGVLLGLPKDGNDRVIATTLSELGRLRDRIVSRHGDSAALDDFFDQLTGRLASR